MAFQHYPGVGLVTYGKDYTLSVCPHCCFSPYSLAQNIVKCQLEGPDHKTQVRPTDMILQCINYVHSKLNGLGQKVIGFCLE